jgi:hypothetical protein
MEEQMEGIDEGDLGTQKNKEVLVTPIAAFHLDIGFVQGNRISNLSDGHKSQISLDNQGPKKTHLEQVAVSDEGLTKENSTASGDNQQIWVHGREGCYLMDKNKWPKLTLPDKAGESDATEGLTQEESQVTNTFKRAAEGATVFGGGNVHTNSDIDNEDIMDSQSVFSTLSDSKKEYVGWQVSKSKKQRKSNKKQVVVATRTSNRVLRDGIPISIKAANRVKALNEISGKPSYNPFTVLNNTSNADLQKVVKDLDIEVVDMDEQLDTFRAEEVVRAAIAEANYKCFLEKQNSKSVS